MNQIGNSVSSSPSWLVPTIIGVGGAAIMALCIVFEKCIPYFINSDDSEEEEEEATISGNTGSSTNPEAAAAMAELPVFVWEESHQGKDNDRDHFLNKLSVEQSPECAICLTELQNGDLARILPNCNHVFHLKCIDSWIPSRSTCPVCRAAIMPLMPGASSSSSNALPVFSSSSRTGVFGPPPLQRLRLHLPIEIPPSSPSSSSSSSSPTVYVPPVFPQPEPIMTSPLSPGEDSVSARRRS